MKKCSVLKGVLVSSFVFAALGVNAKTQIADDGVFTGTFQTVIETNPQPWSYVTNGQNSFDAEDITNTKTITLMRANPTPEMIARAENIATLIDEKEIEENDYSEGVISFDESETAVDLAMNNVPVLDQGKHGTCVTFATTAALDATIDEGDFIDQQCTLAHNLYLGKNYWDGARYASQVIDPLQEYGVVQQGTCPEKYPDPELKVNTKDYKKLVHETINVDDVKYKYLRNMTTDDIENAIDSGHRIAMGFLLKANSDPVSVQGFDVKIDGKTRKGGLWACKQPGSEKNYCGFSFAGHEVVITGYDSEQKLLKIRNSWSAKSGDKGNFYMTYEFFDAMGIDGTAIWLPTEEDE